MRIRQHVTAVLLAASAFAVNAQAPDADSIAAVAQRGDAQEITHLAMRYQHAEGVGRDYMIAHRLYCQAARDGYAEAQFQLGWMYANGRGVARDERTAAALFERAAQLGHEHAQRMLRYVRTHASTGVDTCLTTEHSPSLRLSFTLTLAPTVPTPDRTIPRNENLEIAGR